MKYPQVAAFANETRVQPPVEVLAPSGELYASPLVIAVFAKAFRVKLRICVLAACDNTYRLAVLSFPGCLLRCQLHQFDG